MLLWAVVLVTPPVELDPMGSAEPSSIDLANVYETPKSRLASWRRRCICSAL
jgi:hypothetical protein